MKIFKTNNLNYYLYSLGFKQEEENWTNGDYFTFLDRVIGNGYVYEVKIYIPASDDIAEDGNHVSWIEAGNSDDVTPRYFLGIEDLDDKKSAIRNEEAKLLALGVPFAKSYKFDEDWKKEKNEENRKEWEGRK